MKTVGQVSFSLQMNAIRCFSFPSASCRPANSSSHHPSKTAKMRPLEAAFSQGEKGTAPTTPDHEQKRPTASSDSRRAK